MKRIIALLLSAATLLSVSIFAYADEEFILRNGIKFGDTIEDILEKETTLTIKENESSWFSGTIAGYSDSECGFQFDDDGKLVSMTYDFSKSCTSRETTNNIYEKLYDSLVRKYGKPLGNTGGNVELITGPAIDRMALYVYFLGGLDGNDGDYCDYDEWIVDTDNYHVKIDLISYYWRNSDYEYFYSLDLSYHMYTDADYDAELAAKRAEREEVDNDL